MDMNAGGQMSINVRVDRPLQNIIMYDMFHLDIIPMELFIISIMLIAFAILIYHDVRRNKNE
jgi:cell division protein FtsL